MLRTSTAANHISGQTAWQKRSFGSLPPGPAHWHPATERITVLSGTFYMGMGDMLDTTKGSPIPAGGFAVMQPKTHHFAYTTNEAVELQLHSTGPWGVTYINPADDPRKKP